jgi:hypothetical protein
MTWEYCWYHHRNLLNALVIWIVSKSSWPDRQQFGSAIVAAIVIAVVAAIVAWLLGVLGITIGGGILRDHRPDRSGCGPAAQ